MRNLDDDALADLVAERRVLTTPAGCAACELLAPSIAPSPPSTRCRAPRDPVRLLDFCRTPRKLADINQLLADDPPWLPASEPRAKKLHACYFIDRLEEAGGGVGRILGHYRCGEARPCIGLTGWRYSASP
ncbi:MAG: hypothetical protein ACLT98_17595 [Eggerthellaceae bacterium]